MPLINYTITFIFMHDPVFHSREDSQHHCISLYLSKLFFPVPCNVPYLLPNVDTSAWLNTFFFPVQSKKYCCL